MAVVMEKLLGVAFAILLALELTLLVMAASLVVMLPYLLWQRSPWRAVLAVLGLAGVGIALWRSHRRVTVSPPFPASGPEISISRIPITGAVGAIYMVQFLVWVLVEPAVGLVYAALIAGGLLLLPLILYVNRPGRSASAVSIGALLGALCGMALVSFVSLRELPIAGIFGVAVVAGVLAAPVLIWHRSQQKHVSIAPYSDDRT